MSSTFTSLILNLTHFPLKSSKHPFDISAGSSYGVTIFHFINGVPLSLASLTSYSAIKVHIINDGKIANTII